ncbi:MAG: ABC transporter ATP-binding protein [Lachnospiraceae bacterium]|nr:ABC transporter ATP-binding protein [Lachnospiraceae bacterium]
MTGRFEEKEVYEACVLVDSFIAEHLAESIAHGTSYDALEARYGVLPISRSGFYRKRRIAQDIIEQKMNSTEMKNRSSI